MYKENTIGDKLKKWASGLCVACMVLCSIGAVASLIAYGVNMSTYNEEKDYVKYYLNGDVEYPSFYRAGQTAVSAKQTADACLLYIPALAATAILSPILFGGMYALGVIVIELQKINTCKFAPAVGFIAGNTPEA